MTKKNPIEAGQPTPSSWRLNDEQKLNYEALYILYLIRTEKLIFPNFLTGNLRYTDRAIELLEDKRLIKQEEITEEAKKFLGIKMAEDNVSWVYEVTEQGAKIIDDFTKRYLDFVRYYDVYAHVDFEEGSFAMSKMKKKLLKDNGEKKWKKYLEQQHWEDFRVPVAIYKGIDPREFIFFSFLNEGKYIPDPSDKEHKWAESFYVGTIWEDMYEVLETAPRWEDLQIDDVPAEDVIENIILDGAEVLQKLDKKLKQFIQDQELLMDLMEFDDANKAEHQSDDEAYFEDPVYYDRVGYYTPLSDPFFWGAAIILL